MHQPDTKKRPSVFYDYEVFPFERPPEMDLHGEPHQIVIVGAGPVGLTTALLLAKSGVPSVVIEAAAQVSEGSRAVAFTRRSVEILQQAGAHEPFVDNGLGWDSGRSYYRGQEVFHMRLPHDDDDRFMPVLNNSQQYWEEYLVDFVGQTDLVDLRWQTRFVSLVEGRDAVTLTLDTPEGEYELKTEWLVASDGGRSEVRRRLGLRMEGESYQGKFVITDFKAPDFDYPTERRCYFDPDWNPGNNVLVHKQPNDIWRFDYRVPDGESDEEALAADTIERRTRMIMEMVGTVADWELDWATVYSPNTKTLPDYRHGRVLLAGDAAHLLPIFGVRGANTGMQDAENLAWKLAQVVTGRSSPELLDTYSDERVTAAREICDEAGKSTRLMDPPTRGHRVMRSVILSLSLSHEFCREMLHWRTSRPHEYTDSTLNARDDDHAEFVGGVPVGAVARNVRLGHDDYLFDRFRFGWHLLLFGPDATEADVATLRHRSHVRVIAVGAATHGADVQLTQRSDAVAAKFGVDGNAMVLLRPDMHVCGRWKGFDMSRVDSALSPIFQQEAKL